MALSIKHGFTVIVENPSVSDVDRLMQNAEGGDVVAEFVIEPDSLPGNGASLAIILFCSAQLTGWWITFTDGKQIYYLAREPCRMDEVVHGMAWGADAVLPKCCIVDRSLALKAAAYFLLHEQASSEHLWLRDEDCLQSMA